MVPLPTLAAAAISSTVAASMPRAVKIRTPVSMILLRVACFLISRRGRIATFIIVTTVIYDYSQLMVACQDSARRKWRPDHAPLQAPTPQDSKANAVPPYRGVVSD